jgi:hypothetical protein
MHADPESLFAIIHKEVMERFEFEKNFVDWDEYISDIDLATDDIIASAAVIHKTKVGPRLLFNGEYIGYSEYKSYFKKDADNPSYQLLLHLSQVPGVTFYINHEDITNAAIEAFKDKLKTIANLNLPGRVKSKETQDDMAEVLTARVMKRMLRKTDTRSGSDMLLIREQDKPRLIERANKRKASDANLIDDHITRKTKVTFDRIKNINLDMNKIIKDTGKGKKKKTVLNKGLLTVTAAMTAIWTLAETFRCPTMYAYTLILIYCLRHGFIGTDELAELHPAAYTGSQDDLISIASQSPGYEETTAYARMVKLLKVFIKGVEEQQHVEMRLTHKLGTHTHTSDKDPSLWDESYYEAYVLEIVLSSILGDK